MKKFLIALQFLTILPIKISAEGEISPRSGGKSEIKAKDFGASLAYFPIVGAFIGLLLVLILFVFNFLPHLVTIVLILIGSIIVTGGIHLDGFADTCDGFYGMRSKEQILEVMRDSRIGVMGVIGIVSLLLLKFTLMLNIPQNILWKVLIAMTVFARWSQSLACYISKYARKEGKAKYFIEYAGKKEILMGILLTLGSFLLLMGLKGIALMTLSLLLIFLFINYAKRKIGGMTGDTIGATSEIAELAVLFFVLICF